MVPILTSIIAGEGDDTSPTRGFILALSYVMGMAIVYTAAGIFAVAAGAQVQAAFNQPWVLSVFAGLFVLLAFAMFGGYDLQMPSGIQSKLAGIQQQPEKRYGRRRFHYGCAVISNCHCLRCTSISRRSRRNGPDRRLPARWHGSVRYEPRHGRTVAC